MIIILNNNKIEMDKRMRELNFKKNLISKNVIIWNKYREIRGKNKNINRVNVRIGTLNIRGINGVKLIKVEEIMKKLNISILAIQEFGFTKIHSQEFKILRKNKELGLGFIIHKNISRFIKEIYEINDNIMRIKLGDINIINVYVRKRYKKDIMNHSIELWNSCNRIIILGDWNQNKSEINIIGKYFKNNNYYSRQFHNIDYIGVKNINIKDISVINNAGVSDHRLVLNEININDRMYTIKRIDKRKIINEIINTKYIRSLKDMEKIVEKSKIKIKYKYRIIKDNIEIKIKNEILNKNSNDNNNNKYKILKNYK